MKKRQQIKKWSLLLFPLVLMACKTHNLPRVALSTLPETYNETNISEQDTVAMANIPWQEFFKDPQLQALIKQGLQQNLNMQLAVKNIEESMLLLKLAKAKQLPSLDMSITTSYTDPSKNTLNGRSVEQFLGQNHLEDYNAQLRLSWEADIWGKIKNEKQASLTALLQTTEAQKAVQTSLINQLVKGYYQLLSLQQMKQVAIENMTLSKHSLTLAKHQYDVGEVSSLAIDQLEAQYLAAAALIPDFEQQIAVQEHALRVLCSDFPHAIALTTPSAEIAYPTYYATGVPADLLRNRPDIKQAELEIKRTAIQANIAHKQLYPSLVITAQMGVNALKASNWFNLPGSLFGTVLGGITQPIFQKRELTTNYELAKLNYEKSALQFRQHMVIAVAEVSDALQGIEKLKQREALTKLRANKLNDAIKHAQLLFKNGEATYLDVITAQSHALSTALEIITIRKATLHAFADLYSALGGGVE